MSTPGLYIDQVHTSDLQLVGGGTRYNFGNVTVGNASIKTLSLKNTSQNSITITNILPLTLPPPFAYESPGNTCSLMPTLSPGASCDIPISFSPTVTTLTTTSLYISPGTQITLSGTGQ